MVRRLQPPISQTTMHFMTRYPGILRESKRKSSTVIIPTEIIDEATGIYNGSQTQANRTNSEATKSSRPLKKGTAVNKRAADAGLPIINQSANKSFSVYVFGSGDSGQLGLGPKEIETTHPCKNPFLDPLRRSAFHVKEIACGGMHVVALTVDNQIVTWGVNDNEALGRNTAWDGGLRDVDDESDDEAELNPFESTPTAIPARSFHHGVRFVSVAAGNSCSFALTDTGLVYGWGTFRDPEGKEAFGYSSDGTVIVKQSMPIQVQGLERITQIVCGVDHALALDTAGNIWGWGSGHQNQFGRRLFGRHQDTLRPQIVRMCRRRAKYIASGDYHCFAVDTSDTVWGWGLNSFGQAGDAKTAGSDAAVLPYPMKIPALCGKGVCIMSGGAHHSAAVTINGECYVWGRVDDGQLGIRLTAAQIQDTNRVRCDQSGRPRICLVPTAMPANLGSLSHVACASDHTIVINTSGFAFSTGYGFSGQLGLGMNDDVDTFQRIEGDQVRDETLVRADAGGHFSIVLGK